jgi:hypothetical protein
MGATSESKKTAQDTFNERIDSLTGYEELEIADQFGDDINTLLVTQPSMASRSLVYVTKRREGFDEEKAKDFAMSMTVKAVTDSFEPPELEPMPDEPVTEQGKDGSGS